MGMDFSVHSERTFVLCLDSIYTEYRNLPSNFLARRLFLVIVKV